MPKKQQEKPTDAELQILRVLWSKGQSTVRDVYELLAKTRKVGYTGILKLMQNMSAKGLVKRDATQRSHLYSALLREDQTQRRLVKELLNSAFGGSADKLVMQALRAKEVTPQELLEIRQMLDELAKHQETQAK